MGDPDPGEGGHGGQRGEVEAEQDDADLEGDRGDEDVDAGLAGLAGASVLLDGSGFYAGVPEETRGAAFVVCVNGKSPEA